MSTLLADLRYALRVFVTNPGFAALAVLTLALGIGPNSAIFTVVNAVLLQPLPYPDAGRLVAIYEKTVERDRMPVAPPSYADWAGNKAFASYAVAERAPLTLLGDGDPERVDAAAVSGAFFDTMRVAPARGRALGPDDTRAGQARVVVLSHALWTRRFQQDPNIVGRQLTFDDKPYTVTGVMPAQFDFPAGAQAWIPWAPPPELLTDEGRRENFLLAVGRLRAGVALPQAAAMMNAIAREVTARVPGLKAGRGVTLVPLKEDLVGDVRPALLLLAASVGFVLLVACANVANLLLARATSRDREIAVRLALGASRGRVVRQLLTESIVLALAGGACGLLLAAWSREVIVWLTPRTMPRLGDVRVDGWVLAFTFLVSGLTGIVFGVAPALVATRKTAASLSAGRAVAGRAGRARIRRVLVVVEFALSVVLLVGAGLTARTFWHLLSVDTGFDRASVLTMELFLPPRRYAPPPARVQFEDRAIERLKAVPGVEAVGTTTLLPLRRMQADGYITVFRDGEQPGGQRLATNFGAVSDGYFRAVGMKLLRGRAFTAGDRAGGAGVAIVNETFARRYFAGRDPIGQRVIPAAGRRFPREIVGIVADVRQALEVRADPEIYVPFAQDPFLVIRFAVRGPSVGEMRGALTAAIRDVDKTLPVVKVETLEEIYRASVADPRFNAALLGGFALLALALAAVGIYGVVTSSIGQRLREIAVRVALGAGPRQVVALVARDAGWMIGAGLAAGIILSLALTRLMQRFLFGVAATDAATFAAVALLLAAVAIVAAALPARRVLRVDPVDVLRTE